MNINGIWKSVADVFSTEIAKRCENMSHSVSVEDLVIYCNQSINQFFLFMHVYPTLYTLPLVQVLFAYLFTLELTQCRDNTRLPTIHHPAPHHLYSANRINSDGIQETVSKCHFMMRLSLSPLTHECVILGPNRRRHHALSNVHVTHFYPMLKLRWRSSDSIDCMHNGNMKRDLICHPCFFNSISKMVYASLLIGHVLFPIRHSYTI